MLLCNFKNSILCPYSSDFFGMIIDKLYSRLNNRLQFYKNSQPQFQFLFDCKASNTTEDISLSNGLSFDITEGKIFQKRETQEISLSPDQQFRFERLPCSCQTKECGCCAGIKIPRFKFNQRGCLNFTYNAIEPAMVMNVYLNSKSVYQNRISGLNPPRICIPLPQFPLLMFCVRMYDIRFTGNNVQACVNLEARLQDTTLLVISFDCFSVGGDGFGIVKPGTSSALHSLIATDSENPGGGLYTEKVTSVTESAKESSGPMAIKKIGNIQNINTKNEVTECL